jgi:hypothetical protein
MVARWSAVWLVAAACGGDDVMPPHPDAAPIAQILHISGKAEEYGASGTTPLDGVRIGGYRSSDENAEVTYAITDADGLYSFDLPTGGVAIDGYFKATKDTYMTTYLIPPGLVDRDFSNARVAMLKPDTFVALTDTFCGANQQSTNAAIIVIVADADEKPMAGAMVGSSPAATKYCYNQGGYPNRNATATDTDGIAYYLNVPAGKVTVNALETGVTFPSHTLLARGGVITTTLIRP